MADILTQEEIVNLLYAAEGSDTEHNSIKEKTEEVKITYSMFKRDVILIKSMTVDDMKLAIACLWNSMGIEKSRTPVSLLKYCIDEII